MKKVMTETGTRKKTEIIQEIMALPAPEAAPLLLGQRIISRHGGEMVSGIITEVEAYTQDDPASHTYRGITPRTRAMFGPSGHAYVYFTYGMHYCVNIVCGAEGSGEAVLLRSIVIDHGLDTAIQRRYGDLDPTLLRLRNLSNGPGKLVQALGVSMEDYGQPLFNIDSDLFLQFEQKLSPKDYVVSPRIGIKNGVETLWRWNVI